MSLASELLPGLESMPLELEAAVHLVARDRRGWKPASWTGSPGEGFSVLEHVCHVRDIERDGYHVRIRRLLEEDQPDLVSIDGDALAIERRYAEADLDEALRAFRAARQATLEQIRDLDEAQLGRRGTFAEYGALTLRGLLHYQRSHDLQHLACVQWLVGKLNAPGA
jgi:hypothetical protein